MPEILSQWPAIVEWIAVLLNLIFLYFLIKENVWCWPFGILASALSIFLFLHAKLPSEAILYSYYIIIGIYGWMVWTQKRDKPFRIKRYAWWIHGILIAGGIGLSLALGKFFEGKSYAEKTYADAFSTIFSFIASFLEAQKVLFGWLYWIVLNFFSVWLYHIRGLDVYAGQMVIFGFVSIWGMYSWWKKYQATNQSESHPG
jgi:nicotinamide mononucleotide transporter